jgi:hypothetical protein
MIPHGARRPPLADGILFRPDCHSSQRAALRRASSLQFQHRTFNQEPSMNRHHRIKTIVLTATLLLAIIPLSAAQAGVSDWLGGGGTQGSGKIVKQQRELPHFTALADSTSGDVEIHLGASESVTVETDDNLLPLIETVVENGTLRIRPAKRASIRPHKLKIVVQARSLDHLSLAGSGNMDASGLRAERLQVNVGGSGNLNLSNLQAESLTVALGGSGNLVGSGNVERLDASIGGSGHIKLGQLDAREAAVSIGGSGQATVWARRTLSASVAGSGDISYYGDPQLSRSIAGSGSVSRLGASPR